MANKKISAGLLMYRTEEKGDGLDVFLVHPGGPFFAKKDKGWWSIPKGLADEGEGLLDAAKREFTEETGIIPEPPFLSLSEVTYSGGKKVYAWAFGGNINDDWKLQCNTFPLEWPPRSGKFQDFPECDQGRFFPLAEAAEYILPAQRPFLERLLAALKENGALKSKK